MTIFKVVAMPMWQGADAWHLVAVAENGAERALISFRVESDARGAADHLNAKTRQAEL